MNCWGLLRRGGGLVIDSPVNSGSCAANRKRWLRSLKQWAVLPPYV